MRVLEHRARLKYPAEIEHILVCDRSDLSSQMIVHQTEHKYPHWRVQLLLADPKDGPVASKITKIELALTQAKGEVLCFIDDDILLAPDALQVLIPYLYQPKTGAVFGLACYTNWSTLWSSLMSGFVNANALPTYIPLTYLTQPFTITGHIYALQNTVFDAAGGYRGMQGRMDDDHEIARRVRRLGYRNLQIPLIYEVDNSLATRQNFMAQMKRWFVFPRQTMLPYLTRYEQFISLLGSLGNLIPGLLALLALFSRRPSTCRSLCHSLGLFGLSYALIEKKFIRRRTPIQGWFLLAAVALLLPFQVLLALFSNNDIDWRGQRLRIHKNGTFDVL